MVTATRTTWHEIGELMERFGGGKPRRVQAGERHWQVPCPPGYLRVEVTLRPKWCAVVIDRWHTKGRDPDGQEWFKATLWPFVIAAVKRRRGGSNCLPSGNPTISQAFPIARDDLLTVLELWVAMELSS